MVYIKLRLLVLFFLIFGFGLRAGERHDNTYKTIDQDGNPCTIEICSGYNIMITGTGKRITYATSPGYTSTFNYPSIVKAQETRESEQAVTEQEQKGEQELNNAYPAVKPRGQSGDVALVQNLPIAVSDTSWLQNMNTPGNRLALAIAALSGSALVCRLWPSHVAGIGHENEGGIPKELGDLKNGGSEALKSEGTIKNNYEKKSKVAHESPLTVTDLLQTSRDYVVKHKENFALGGTCVAAFSYLTKNGIQAYCGHGKK